MELEETFASLNNRDHLEKPHRSCFQSESCNGTLEGPTPLTLTRKVISYWAEECLKDLQETMAVEGIWHADFSVLVFCIKEQLLTLRGELHSSRQMFLFFYSLKFCVWLCWLLLFVSILAGTLSCLLQCWPEILCAMTFPAPRSWDPAF